MATRILVVDDSPTIRAVVASILARHGYESDVAVDGQDALEALSTGRVKADLVLVDFVMPRMNGYQFCRALRANDELAALPIVLMSAKSDRIRDQFVQQTGALDALTKPFDAQALVAVIENALRKVNTNRASATRLPDLGPDDELTRMGTAQMPALNGEHETRRTHVAQIIAEKLASIVAHTVFNRPRLSTQSDLEAALANGLSNDAILEMMETARAIVRKDDVASILAGDLGTVPVGAVLQLLQAENQTGVLVCSNGEAEIRATFRAGAIDLVQSTGAGDEFRLGRFFVDEGVLTPSEIDAVQPRPSAEGRHEDTAPRSVVQMRETPAGDDAPRSSQPSSAPEKEQVPEEVYASETVRGQELAESLAQAAEVVAGDEEPKPLGMRLLAAAKITEAQLREALTRQSSELLYEVLRWRSGRFDLRRESPSVLADNAKLALPVASVVMEGFRRVDEWRVLERTLGSFDAVLVRDDAAFGALDIASLPSRERAVLDAVDGERTVRAIVAASHLSSFDACRILVQFLEARVLRERAA